MKINSIRILIFLIYFNLSFLQAQEYKSFKKYQKLTGKSVLDSGSWLKKDRKKNSKNWKLANLNNLKLKNGVLKYQSIRQKRDFYLWFDHEIIKKGHEIKWIGIASIAADQLSKIENPFIRILLIRNKEVVKFLHQGSEEVFTFAFPQLQKVYFSKDLITSKNAKNWDQNYGLKEQCIILEPLYAKLSKKAKKKLLRMAKGEGLYSLGIPENLRFNGKIDDCTDRYEHGIQKLLPYYLAHSKN